MAIIFLLFVNKREKNNNFKYLLYNLKMLSIYLLYEKVHDLARRSYYDRLLCGAALLAVVIH